MNCIKLTSTLALITALAAGTMGCKHGLQKPTPIHDQNAGGVGGAPPIDNIDHKNNGDTGIPPSRPLRGDRTDITSTPFSPSGDNPLNPDFDPTKMNQDSQIFAADTVYFDFDKSNIRPDELPKIEHVASALKGMLAGTGRGNGLVIGGYCDERGTEEYNKALGERRALAVRETLLQLGVPANRVVTISYGESDPADPGHNEAAWAKNRRAQFVLCTPK